MSNRITSDKYKAIKVINSCKTFEQTRIAEKFCTLYLHRYNTDIGIDHYYDLLILVTKKRREIVK
jgi:hypothetical protein